MGKRCIRRMLSRLTMAQELPEGSEAACGSGCEGHRESTGPAGAEGRHRPHHRQRRHERRSCSREADKRVKGMPADGAVMGYPVPGASLDAEAQVPESPRSRKRHHHNKERKCERQHGRHHEHRHDSGDLHIHHHIYCEAGETQPRVREALRRYRGRHHGRRCTEHVHFHYGSGSTEPVAEGTPSAAAPQPPAVPLI